MAEAGPQQPFDDEFARMADQMAFDDAAAAMEAHEGRLAAQTSGQFDKIMMANRLDPLSRQIDKSTRILADSALTDLMELGQPDLNLKFAAQKEARIAAWVKEGVAKGEDPETARAKYEQWYREAAKRSQQSYLADLGVDPNLMGNSGKNNATAETPRQSRMRRLGRSILHFFS